MEARFGAFLLKGRGGPAEEPREAPSSPPLGVPGPKEDWRRDEEVVGMDRWCGRRRRLGSVDGERLCLTEARLWLAIAEAVELEGRGEGCRW